MGYGGGVAAHPEKITSRVERMINGESFICVTAVGFGCIFQYVSLSHLNRSN